MEQKVVKKKSGVSSSEDCNADELRIIILHNDDVNTFDHVIDSLIQVCRHDSIQAEQCAYITHHKGKCDVKSGSYSELSPIRLALLDRGLQVTID
ncbi:MAG: ATP-dependent Clp protease adaptor ClpS [Bacteroidota bacterium]|nr:ATP-dependent Clp protease adaptor ClpS [Bacteroidota bacterium]